jgi:hypothetical protein
MRTWLLVSYVFVAAITLAAQSTFEITLANRD